MLRLSGKSGKPEQLEQVEFVSEDTPSADDILLKWPFPPAKIDEVAGCLRYEGAAKTVEEMEQAIRLPDWRCNT